MKTFDDIAKRALEITRQDSKQGINGTSPWLDLNLKVYEDIRSGKSNILPPPYRDDPADRIMMSDLQGTKVLCLAGGGGQQSVVFSLLGAEVTVFDLTPEQLENDKKAAKHYGYEIDTIQGDMRDLSELCDDYFDRVYQPISTLYVPDLKEVYSGVNRVLKHNGLYYSDYAMPLLYLADNLGWDGNGYTLYITEPYQSGPIYETKDGKLNLTDGKSFSEFHHLLSDIINGQIFSGFTIKGLWENPRPNSVAAPIDKKQHARDENQEKYLPWGITVVSLKK